MGVAYVYKWVHTPTRRWYVGSRTYKKATFTDGYICSSKTVKPMILSAPAEWHKEIIAIGNAEDMRFLETEILTATDAKRDKRSLNKHNQDLKFVCKEHTAETKAKIKKNHAFAGRKRPEHAKAMAGKKRAPEDVLKWAKTLRGKSKTAIHIQNLKTAKAKGIYQTPAGEFASSRDAAESNGCAKSRILQRCHGFISSRGKWYGPVSGWVFIPKVA